MLLNSFGAQSFHKRTEEHRGTKNNSPCISVLSVFFVVKKYLRKLRFLYIFAYFFLFFLSTPRRGMKYKF